MLTLPRCIETTYNGRVFGYLPSVDLTIELFMYKIMFIQHEILSLKKFIFRNQAFKVKYNPLNSNNETCFLSKSFIS